MRKLKASVMVLIIALSILAVIQFKPVFAVSSLLVYYSDMETMHNATYLDDLSKNTNYGEIIGATNVTGKYGNALSFDGENDQVLVTDDDSLDGMDKLTVTAWCYSYPTEPAAYQILIQKSTTYYIAVDRTNDRVDFRVWNASTSAMTISDVVLEDNVWFHIAGVYNETYVYLYINGERSGDAVALTGSVRETSGNLSVGVDPPLNYFFNGTIDEVRIYESALTKAGVQADMTNSGYTLETKSTPSNVAFTLNGTSHNTTYSELCIAGNYQVNFTSSFSRAGLTWTFAYWNDNTSNTNPDRTIDLQSDTTLSVTYTSTYEPIEYAGYDTVFECAMNNMFELNGILEGNDTYRQMLLDSSIYENHGKIYPLDHPYAGPTLTWGRMGKALEFDGVDDSVIVANSDSLNFSEALTVEFWFMVYNATPSQKFISKYYSGSGQWIVGIKDSKLYTELWTTSTTLYFDKTSSENITEGVFYFFSLTYDYRDGYYTVYLHGVPQFNVTTDGNKIRDVDTDLYLGSLRNVSYWFEGVLDEVRIFPYKRSLAEIYTDARTPIARFDSWSFVNSGTSPDGEDWTVVEGTTSGYQGFKGNDPILPWAYANDTHPYTFVRTIHYMAGFQGYQLYCTLNFNCNAVPSERENYVLWYWSFFKDGRLQATYDIMIKPYSITLSPTTVHQWYVYFRRTTPYFETTELVDAYIDVNTTLFQHSIPIIVSAWVGPNNKHFSCRIDFQDARASTESGIDFPFTYSFDLVDEDLNPHVVQWFDGWVVAGIKVKAHSSSVANSWAKMEIESHKLNILKSITNFFTTVVGPAISYVWGVAATFVSTVAKAIEVCLMPIAEFIGTAVRIIGETVVDALAGLAHDLIGALGGVADTIFQAMRPISDFLGKLGGAIVQAFITFMEPALNAAAMAGMAIADGLFGLIDGLFGLLGVPGGFTLFLNFIGSLWTFLTNAIAWVLLSLISFFAFLPSFIGKAVNTITTATGIFTSMFTWFWWVLDSAHGGAQSLWLTIRLDLWIQLGIILYPVFLLWKWEEEGLDAVIAHLKMIFDILAMLVHGLITVIQLFINIISSLIEAIPVIEILVPLSLMLATRNLPLLLVAM